MSADYLNEEPSGIILNVLSKTIDVIGELLLIAGMLVALFTFYLLYRFGLETEKAQQQAREELQQAWSVPASAPASAPEGTEPAIEGS